MLDLLIVRNADNNSRFVDSFKTLKHQSKTWNIPRKTSMSGQPNLQTKASVVFTLGLKTQQIEIYT